MQDGRQRTAPGCCESLRLARMSAARCFTACRNAPDVACHVGDVCAHGQRRHIPTAPFAGLEYVWRVHQWQRQWGV